MNHYLTVDFGDDLAYDFRVAAQEAARIGPEAAQQWVEAEFLRAGFTPVTGMDPPQLAADMILKIARVMGPEPFRARSDWAQQYALHVCVLVDRANVTVDVDNATVGF